MGPSKERMSRSEAVEQYVILRLRVEDINRLDYLLNGLHDRPVSVPPDSPYSAKDLKDTVRTSLLGWLATLTDRDPKTVYAFDPLLALFPDRRSEIITAQIELEACHAALQRFRNNVAFHSRSDVAAQISARLALREEDTFLDVVSALHRFQKLMNDLRQEELKLIPELPRELARLGVSRHPAFRNVTAETGR